MGVRGFLKREWIAAATGERPADHVFSNATIFNPFDCTWEEGDIAVCDGVVVGIGSYRGYVETDLRGAEVVPGLIDAHVHIESSLLTPCEFGRVVLPRGVTTVIADPHEIANVAGLEGIEFMLREARHTPLDILLMVPSCVPATPRDTGGAILSSDEIAAFRGREGVIGLGEMMNVPGVLECDPDVWKKLSLFSPVDGHAPGLRGKLLNAYILAGIDSDHESIGLDEAREKLRRGMYIMIREGAAARNLSDLVPLLTTGGKTRCCFATDDRPADMLMDNGSIDDCIRKAVEAGIEREIAISAATLWAAERFGLHDRGAISPGRIADLCQLERGGTFLVKRTYKRGSVIRDLRFRETDFSPPPFLCHVPEPSELAIEGGGRARVIGLVPHQIKTGCLLLDVDGDDIPDPSRDLLAAVVCDRYHGKGFATGIVHGFGIQEGAIATSVAHDSHNVVGVGADLQDLSAAVREVARHGGGMMAVSGKKRAFLPLPCCGLMYPGTAEDVRSRLHELRDATRAMGALDQPFMYLSFLTLTVIPSLRLTVNGLFDSEAFSPVPLFTGEGSSERSGEQHHQGEHSEDDRLMNEVDEK